MSDKIAEQREHTLYVRAADPDFEEREGFVVVDPKDTLEQTKEENPIQRSGGRSLLQHAGHAVEAAAQMGSNLVSSVANQGLKKGNEALGLSKTEGPITRHKTLVSRLRELIGFT